MTRPFRSHSLQSPQTRAAQSVTTLNLVLLALQFQCRRRSRSFFFSSFFLSFYRSLSFYRYRARVISWVKSSRHAHVKLFCFCIAPSVSYREIGDYAEKIQTFNRGFCDIRHFREVGEMSFIQESRYLFGLRLLKNVPISSLAQTGYRNILKQPLTQ